MDLDYVSLPIDVSYNKILGVHGLFFDVDSCRLFFAFSLVDAIVAAATCLTYNSIFKRATFGIIYIL